jgi:hypothetical protein
MEPEEKEKLIRQMEEEITQQRQKFMDRKPIRERTSHELDFITITTACQLSLVKYDEDDTLAIAYIPVALPISWINFIKILTNHMGQEYLSYVFAKIFMGAVFTIIGRNKWSDNIVDYKKKLRLIQETLTKYASIIEDKEKSN